MVKVELVEIELDEFVTLKAREFTFVHGGPFWYTLILRTFPRPSDSSMISGGPTVQFKVLV
jgi:hypothetical protein